METGDIIGILILIVTAHFAMTVLIKAELGTNPDPTDGLLFRWKATRGPMALFILAAVFIYEVYFSGYHLFPGSLDEKITTWALVGNKILLVLVITVPVIFYGLLSYKRY